MDPKIITELEDKATALEEDARKIRAAIEVLKDVRGPHTNSPARIASRASRTRAGGTLDQIREILAETPPLSVAEILDTLYARAWTTESANPSNTVRTAIGRLLERGAVVKSPDGRYTLPDPPEGQD
jgi:hypothetical protein